MERWVVGGMYRMYVEVEGAKRRGEERREVD